MRSKKQSLPETTENIWAFLKEIAKEAVKEAAKEAAKEAVKEAAKEAVKEAAKEVAKKVVKENQENQEIREIKKENREMIKEMRRETKTLKGELNKMYAESRKERAESRKERKELNQQLGGISNSNGEMAETYFYNALKRDKTFVNEKFDSIKRNRKFANNEIEAEFDIILFNGRSAAIIEVKYNAKPDNISVRRIISRVEAFKLLYPDCKDHNIYLGVAAMTFRKGLEQRLHRNGIATIRQVGKKMVVYDREVKVF